MCSSILGEPFLGELAAGGESEFRCGVAGGDGVDADALGGHLERRGPGEAVDRVLAGAIERRSGAAPLAEGRGEG